jgi:hypothetical protein
VNVSTEETLRSVQTTLNLLFDGLIAKDYDFLNIDLSIARTDALISENVISLAVIDVSSGATYSVKLFDTTKPSLDETVLTKGTVIERLNKAKVYLSNSAQAGAFLKLLVLKG